MENNSKNKSYPISFLIPGTIIYLMLFVLPIFISLYYSFTNWDFFSASFIGLENYKSILFNLDMRTALWNTVIFTAITTIFKVSLGVLIAVYLNQKLKITNYLRTVFYLPTVISTVSIGILFTAILHPTEGLLNKILNAIGCRFIAQDWLANVHIAIYSICGIEIWKWTGFTMVLILAGLQTISFDYYEAANIDGASPWQKFIKITLPLLRPAINIALISNLIGGLKVFDIIQVTTGGGPGFATSVISSIIYRSYSGAYQGEACAGNIILGLFVGLIVLVTYNFVRKGEVEL